MNRRLSLLLAALLGALLVLSQSAVGQSVSSSIARALRTSSGTVLTVGAVSDGQVLTRSGTSIIGAAASSGVGGSTGATDNRVLRADGAGGATVQSSAITIDDSGNVTGAGTIDVGATDTTLSRTGAGNIAVEGSAIYRAGGTDVPLTDGGTGASSASDARTNLGLGTTATYTALALPSPSANAVARVPAGWVYDLCDEPDDANLLSGADTGTTWVSTNLTSAARASGVITVVHSTTTDGGSSRQDGTQPAVTFDHTPMAGRLVVNANVGTDGNYYILNPFLRHPGGGNAYYGLQVFNGILEAWYGSTRGTTTTTTTSDRWYSVEWNGNTGRLFWSSSASEPTTYSSSAASGWAFLDAFTISDPSSGSRPLVGVGFWHFTGSASVTYTIRTLRLEAL